MQEIAPLLDAGIEVRWIRGNHDTDTQLNWGHLADAMHLNIDGKVCELNGIRIAGLGGVFRREIWLPDPANPGGMNPNFTNYQTFVRTLKERAVANSLVGVIDHLDALSGQAELIRSCKILTHLSSIFWDTYEGLWDQSADILVTHEAPSCHPSGFAVIDELAQAMGVGTVFHGHHHDSLDYEVRDARPDFRVFGVGLRGISDETGCKIRPGESDDVRNCRVSSPIK